MKKLLLKVLIIVGTLASGAVALNQYLRHNLQQAFDNVIRDAKPLAHIEYRSLTLVLPDRIELRDLRIIPTSPVIGNFSIAAINLTVTDPDPLLLAKRLLGLTSRQTPDQLSLDILGFTMSPAEFREYSDVLKQLNKDLSQQMTLTCGDTQMLGPDQLQDLGYDPLHLNLHFDYQLNPWDKSLTINSDTEMEKGSATHIQVTLGNIPTLDTAISKNAINPQALNPTLDKLIIHYEDHDYSNKVNSYCAIKSGLSLADYIERETTRSDHDYALMWGIIPGTEIKKAYRRFMLNPQRATVTIRPPSELNWLNLLATKPEQWPSQLNMDVLVNDEPVPSLDFHMADVNQLVNAAAESAQQQSSSSEKAKLTTFRTLKLQFHAADKAAVNTYKGKTIRVFTNTNRMHEGILVDVNNQKITLRQQIFGGQFDIKLNLINIERLEVGR